MALTACDPKKTARQILQSETDGLSHRSLNLKHDVKKQSPILKDGGYAALLLCHKKPCNIKPKACAAVRPRLICAVGSVEDMLHVDSYIRIYLVT